ncbi:hypothetical protein Q8F55_003310 [Vanrija albida]|uniref:Uncharacterized protein n=1 Tax=Vanrija albida TaxID=181172 RepID=A0ABR3Q3K1_9TREE
MFARRFQLLVDTLCPRFLAFLTRSCKRWYIANRDLPYNLPERLVFSFAFGGTFGTWYYVTGPWPREPERRENPPQPQPERTCRPWPAGAEWQGLHWRERYVPRVTVAEARSRAEALAELRRHALPPTPTLNLVLHFTPATNHHAPPPPPALPSH